MADSISDARDQHDFLLWAYVFMPEHVHLMIYPTRASYAVRQILKAIKEPVGRKGVKYLGEHAPRSLPHITVKHGKRTGRRFWQAGGGFDHNALDPKVILRMIEYIHNNPVSRGQVLRAEDWKWSSAGWHEGKNSLAPTLSTFAGLPGTGEGANHVGRPRFWVSEKG